MTRDKGGPPIDPDGTPEPGRENRGRDQAGTAGNAAAEGDRPPPGGRRGGEAPPADDCTAIDLDSAHDRAS